MSYIPRHLETEISAWLRQTKPPYHTILLGGARQCGKSTLLKHLFPENQNLYIDLSLESGFCEDIDRTQHFNDLTLLLENRFGFKVGSESVLIIDEAQLSKKLGGYVRYFKELWRNQRVILTGSTLSTLFENHENPTGRIIEFALRPFDFQEFLLAMGRTTLLEQIQSWTPTNPLSETAHQEAVFSLKDYLIVGGLPEVVTTFADHGDHERLLANLYALYKRDFDAKFTENDITIFHQCFQRIAAATGSPIKNSSIIKSSSSGYHRVADVLQTLENWHLILKVACETSQLSKVETMTPKRYVFDHGIRFIQNPSRFSDINLTDDSDPRREEWGGLIENFVATELLTLNSPYAVKSWSKTNQSGNVDFIFTNQNSTTAIEVKLTHKFNRKHLAGLIAYHQFYKNNSLVLTNLHRGGLHREQKMDIINIPVYALRTHFQS